MALTVGGKDFRARTGDVVVFSPSDSYTARSDGGCSFNFTFFALEMGRATDLLCDLGLSGIITKDRGKEYAHLLDKFERMRGESTKNGIELYALLLSYITALIGAVKRGEIERFYSEGEGARNDELKDIIKYVNANIAYGLRTADIARRFNIGEKNLIRKFNASLGLAPKKYITQVKMERAIELMDTEKMKLSEVAAALGYSDQYAFSKAFKQFYSISPAEHRKNISQKT